MPETSVKKTGSKSANAEKRKRRKQREKEEATLIAKCEKLLGKRVAKAEYPGGRTRAAFRLVMQDSDPVFVSIRPKRNRASIERKVLRALADHAAVPRLLGSDGEHMVLQQEIAGERLSQAMHNQPEERIERVVDGALTTLYDSQQAGSAAGFDKSMLRVGATFKWLTGLLDRPAVIGKYFDVPAPRPELKKLEELLAVRTPRFVKWDARPGNAMVTADDKVYWFDWEHCGARNRLDDMVWLLADEYVPEYPAAEQRLIDKHIAGYADDLSPDEARHYLSAYGVFHITVRLGLICKYKERGDWWDHDYCLSRDKVGVSELSVSRLCERGERWARLNPHTEALAPWFAAIGRKLLTGAPKPTLDQA